MVEAAEEGAGCWAEFGPSFRLMIALRTTF
jgi:hypothetical protein